MYDCGAQLLAKVTEETAYSSRWKFDMVRATAAASAGGVLMLLLLLPLLLLPRAPLLTLLCSAGPHHQGRQGQDPGLHEQ